MPLNINDWRIKAQHDLESADILFERTSHYDIIVYHAHQAVEKMLKWFLLKHDCTFPFVHDLILLHDLCIPFLEISLDVQAIGFLNKQLPNTRYPLGEWIEKEAAQKSLEISKTIFNILNKGND